MSIKVDVSTYSAATRARLTQQLSKDIQQSAQESPELRKEIARVFQMANRRIQNLQNSKDNVISPALQALGERADIESYSKFRIGSFGHTNSEWEKLKIEYGKAIAFLQQPTSTVKGAKEFEKHVKDGIFRGSELDDKAQTIFWDAIKDDIINGFNDVSSSMLGAMQYRDMMQEIYDRAVEDSASLIERLAMQYSDDLQNDINSEAARLAVEAFNNIDDYIDNMLNSFAKL